MAFFKFENIYKYFDDRLILNNVSYEFKNNGLVMLLGESGSGKTTLLNILLGIIKKDKGKIIYKDKELKSDKDFLNFRKEVSIVFQEYGVINNLSGYDNLFLGGFNNKNDNSLLKDQLLLKNAGTFSGGEKQRLAILRAVNNDSSIIFCDEPTGSLDEKTSIQIMDIIKKISLNKLVIMVTHNEELTKIYGDVVLYLSSNNLIIKKEKCIKNVAIQNKKNNKKNYLLGINIATKSFFKEKVKLLLSFISLSLSLTTIFTLCSLKQYSYKAIENEIRSYADYNRIKVSKVTSMNIENTNFSLMKVSCPSFKDINNIVNDYGEINYSFDTFFMNSEIICNDVKIDASIIVFPFEERKDNIRINSNMYELIKDLSSTIMIKMSNTIVSKYNNKVCEDVVNFSFESSVSKVYNEFSLINYPVIYISQEKINEIFKNIKLKNLSKIANSKYVSLYDRYTLLLSDDDSISNYSIYVDIYNKNDVMKVIEIFNNYNSNNVTYDIESRAISAYETLSSSLKLVELLMNIFSIISIIISTILLILFVNCSYYNRKKEFALYKAFGLSSNELFFYNFIPIIIFFYLSFFFSIYLYKLLNNYLGNKLIFFFGFNILKDSLFVKNNYLLIMLILLFASLILSLYISLIIKRIKINEVIKSE